MAGIPEGLGEVFPTGDVFIIEILPLPMCRRVRARRGRKMRGRAFYGCCSCTADRIEAPLCVSRVWTTSGEHPHCCVGALEDQEDDRGLELPGGHWHRSPQP